MGQDIVTNSSAPSPTTPLPVPCACSSEPPGASSPMDDRVRRRAGTTGGYVDRDADRHHRRHHEWREYVSQHGAPWRSFALGRLITSGRA